MPKSKSCFIPMIPIEEDDRLRLEAALENNELVILYGKEGIMKYVISFKKMKDYLYSLIVYSIPGMNIEVRDCYKSETFPTIPGGKEVNQKIKSIYDKANGIYKEMTMNV